MDRHESLRTKYVIKEGNLLQFIPKDEPELPIRYFDLRNNKDKDQILEDLIKETNSRKFDYEEGPLVHFDIVLYSEELSGIMVSMDHSISDWTSTKVLRKEIGQLHEAFRSGGKNPLPPMRLQYKDYAAWINGLLSSTQGRRLRNEYLKIIWKSIQEERSEQLKSKVVQTPRRSYKEELGKELEQILGGRWEKPFTKAYGRLVNLLEKGISYGLVIEEESFNGLKQLATRCETSLYMTLLASQALWVGHIRNSKHVRILTPFSTRIFPEFENIVGWLNSDVVIPLEIDRKETFEAFISRTSQTVLSSAKYRFYPHEAILKDLDIPMDELAPAFLNYIRHEKTVPNNLVRGHVNGGSGHFNILVSAFEYKNCIALHTSYNNKLFKEQDVETMVALYRNILDLMLTQSRTRLVDLQLTPLLPKPNLG